MPGAPAPAARLDAIHRASWTYFAREVHPRTGLVPDSTRPDSPASIAAVGFALSGYPVAVERGWMERDEARRHTLNALRFFHDAPQDGARKGTGYKGFYYHFLDLETGRRAWKSELSTLDTALLLAGALTAAAFFDGEGDEAEVRALADALYRRTDWAWALNDGDAVTHGWTPERDFLRWRYRGYSEALLLYLLGLGSPTHPLPPSSYDAFTASYRWKTLYGHTVLYAGPLFIHQFPHLWIDFRGIRDAAMHERDLDYFENSRRATHIQRAYAIRNPRGFAHYEADVWGVTASDGPGNVTRTVEGRTRRFYDYRARGVPFGPDDGTLAPWAAIASLPFAPDIVLSCIECVANLHEGIGDEYGFENSYNPTYPDGHPHLGWVSPWHFALNQGPIVLAMQNHATEQIWALLRRNRYVIDGLRQAGFTGGWLDVAS